MFSALLYLIPIVVETSAATGVFAVIFPYIIPVLAAALFFISIANVLNSTPSCAGDTGIGATLISGLLSQIPGRLRIIFAGFIVPSGFSAVATAACG